MTKHLLFASAAFATTVVLLSAQGPAAPGPFTAAQATAGGTAYQANCAACHGPDLRGIPPLAGPDFASGWSTRSTRDLFNTIRASMPSDRPGTLSEETYLNVVAFILQSNGRTPGTQALTPTTDAPIGAAAAAAPPAPAAAQAAQAAPAAGGRQGGAAGGGRGGAAQGDAPAGRGAGAAGGGGAGGGRGAAAPAPTGLTVAGEVRNFTRVTDDMLRNPPAGDWLLLRRDH